MCLKRPNIAHMFWYHFRSIRVALEKAQIDTDWGRKVKIAIWRSAWPIQSIKMQVLPFTHCLCENYGDGSL